MLIRQNTHPIRAQWRVWTTSIAIPISIKIYKTVLSQDIPTNFWQCAIGNRKSIRSAGLPACVNQVLVQLWRFTPWKKRFSKEIHIQLKLIWQFLRRPGGLRSISRAYFLRKKETACFDRLAHLAIWKERRQFCAVVSLIRGRLPVLPLSPKTSIRSSAWRGFYYSCLCKKKRQQFCTFISLIRWRLPALPLSPKISTGSSAWRGFYSLFLIGWLYEKRDSSFKLSSLW